VVVAQHRKSNRTKKTISEVAKSGSMTADEVITPPSSPSKARATSRSKSTSGKRLSVVEMVMPSSTSEEEEETDGPDETFYELPKGKKWHHPGVGEGEDDWGRRLRGWKKHVK